MDISDWRKKIDDLDRKLAALLNERARAAIEIGRLKRHTNLPVYEPEREREVIANVQRSSQGPLAERDLAQIYERMAALKDYTTICNSAPSEFLAELALRHRAKLAQRNLDIIAHNHFVPAHEHLWWNVPMLPAPTRRCETRGPPLHATGRTRGT